MPLHYQEFSAAPQLSSLVRCYWAIGGVADESDPQVNRVTPDGCLDVVFDLRQHAAVVVGAMLQASVFRHAAAVDMFGVRFVPGAAPIFLGFAADEITGAVVPAAEVWGDADLLGERLSHAGDARPRIFDRFLIERLNAK